jgi:hypothetical protein
VAINLQIEYGGEIVVSFPLEVTERGYHVKAVLNAQVGHIWRPSKLGAVRAGAVTADPGSTQTLKIILRADTANEVSEFDFFQLRTAVVKWLYQEVEAS